MTVYILSMTEKDNLALYDLNTDGTLTLRHSMTVPTPMYACIGNGSMYLALREPFGEAQSGVVRLACENGEPVHLTEPMLPCKGRIACHIALSPDGKYLYTANYRSGNISEFSLDDDGAILQLHALLQFPTLNESSIPHAHGIFFTMDGKYLCAPDLGNDRIWLYPMSEDGAVDKPSYITVPAGSGPRHLAVSQDGKHMYLVCQNSFTVHAYTVRDTGWTETSCISTEAPAGIRCQSSAIRLSADEKWLYVSNRGANTISMISIADEKLKLVCNAACGNNPRDMDLSPDGKWLVLGNMDDGCVTVFRIDTESGRLIRHSDIQCDAPVAIMF